jgi:hypothetical protein
MIPQNVIVHHFGVLLHLLLGCIISVLVLFEGKDVDFTVVDHLIGDLHKEVSHSVIGVVVSSNCMDHFNAIH